MRARILQSTLKSRGSDESDEMNCAVGSASLTVSSDQSSLLDLGSLSGRRIREARGTKCFGARRDAVQNMDAGRADQSAPLPVSLTQGTPLVLAGRGQEM